tara:strand:+ start:2119 stop:2427 length:309 start_codon:yes stop_codon:yes gene_type:complete
MSFLRPEQSFTNETPASISGVLEKYIAKNDWELEYVAGNRPEENVFRFKLSSNTGEVLGAQDHEGNTLALQNHLSETLGGDYFVTSGESPEPYIQIEKIAPR